MITDEDLVEWFWRRACDASRGTGTGAEGGYLIAAADVEDRFHDAWFLFTHTKAESQDLDQLRSATAAALRSRAGDGPDTQRLSALIEADRLQFPPTESLLTDVQVAEIEACSAALSEAINRARALKILDDDPIYVLNPIGKQEKIAIAALKARQRRIAVAFRETSTTEENHG